MRLRARHLALGVAATAIGACSPTPTTAPTPVVRYVEVPVPVPASTTPMVRCPTPGPEAPPPMPVGTDERRVRFVLYPAGAELELDGEDVVWFGATHVLSIGAHRVRARVGGSSCCEPREMSINVTAPPDEDRDAIQTVAVTLVIHDAHARLVGAPENGYAACDNGVVVRDHHPVAIPMHELSWTGTCSLLPGTARTTVTLEAGRTTTLRWPTARR